LVVRVWLLILLLSPVALQAEEPPAERNHCLDCHPVHYVQRASCIDCHRGHPGTARIKIAHDGLIAGRFAAFTLEESPVVKRGEQRLKDYACRRCHVTAGKGNRVAANLDLSQQETSPEELAEAIKSPVLFMPDFHFSEQQRVELVNALLAGAMQVELPEGELPAVIHFEGKGTSREIQFEKHCGGCHRVLTMRYGGLGHGLIGPNLSGLFSEFYLKNFGEDGRAWTVESLEKWLKNPRKIRPLSQMPPLQLKPDEFQALVRELQPLNLAGAAFASAPEVGSLEEEVEFSSSMGTPAIDAQ
jgi:cytochrome c2